MGGAEALGAGRRVRAVRPQALCLRHTFALSLQTVREGVF